MKDEIKEILDELESLFEISEAPEHIINGFNKIKDYITNLQEENKIRQQDINNLTYQLAKEKSRIEKAREYIRTHYLKPTELELENILNGDDE